MIDDIDFEEVITAINLINTYNDDELEVLIEDLSKLHSISINGISSDSSIFYYITMAKASISTELGVDINNSMLQILYDSSDEYREVQTKILLRIKKCLSNFRNRTRHSV